MSGSDVRHAPLLIPASERGPIALILKRLITQPLGRDEPELSLMLWALVGHRAH